MKKIAVLLCSVGVLIAGCADYAAPAADHAQEQKSAQQPVDRNRNGVPDPLERKAVPLEPVIDRPLKSAD